VTESEREWFEERAAIREHEGGQLKRYAEFDAVNDLAKWKRERNERARKAGIIGNGG